MKLTFSWDATGAPFCDADVLGADGVSPLACLLMDDGGTGIESSREWIAIGLDRVDAAIAGTAANTEWSREDWRADLGRENTRVHSMHDESCAEGVSTTAFREAMSRWQQFITAGPTREPVVIDLGD